jgi:hypothetical protein
LSVLVALLVGLVWWVAAWSFGVKAFDAFLVTVLIVVGAATARLVSPFVHQALGRAPKTSDPLGPPTAPGS